MEVDYIEEYLIQNDFGFLESDIYIYIFNKNK